MKQGIDKQPVGKVKEVDRHSLNANYNNPKRHKNCKTTLCFLPF